jgi:hypothetical protein
LAGPDPPAGGGRLAGALQPKAHFGQATTITPDPGEDLLDNVRLFRNRLKSSVTFAIVNGDKVVPVRGIGHHVERTALRGALLASPTPLHDLGSLVLGDDALYLKQQIIFRTSAERPVQE